MNDDNVVPFDNGALRLSHETMDELGISPYDDDRNGRPTNSPPRRAYTLTRLSHVQPRPVRWCWQDRIALGKQTSLGGRPKVGKGLLYSRVIAQVTHGTLPGDLDGPRNAILVTTEDTPEDTLVPRLLAAGADTTRVTQFHMGSSEEPVPFRVPRDAKPLRQAVEDESAALVVIDPLVEFIDGKVDSYKSQQVRQALAALNEMARQTGCAVLVIFHLNKSSGTDPLRRQEAAAAFVQVVRGGLLLGYDPDDPNGERGDRRVLAVSYSNLARIPAAIAYRIEDAEVSCESDEKIATAKLVEHGGSTATASDLLRDLGDDEVGAAHGADEFLRAALADGPRPVDDVLAGARAECISKRTLERAKSKLKIASTRVGGIGEKGAWRWSLPTAPKTGTTKGANPSENDGALSDGALSENAGLDRSFAPSEPLRTPETENGALSAESGLNAGARCVVCHSTDGARLAANGTVFCGDCWGLS